MTLNIAKYAAKRLLLAIPTLFALSLIIYYTTTFFPASKRVALFMPTNPYKHPGHDITSAIPELIEKYHLNDPFYIQYAIWIRGVLEGNLGYSYQYDQPVTRVILNAFPATLEIVIFASPIIFFAGYRLGVLSAKRAFKKMPQEDKVDFTVRSVSILGYSIPRFCIALLLLVVFYACLKWVDFGRLGSASLAIVRSTEWTSYTGLFTLDALLNGRLSVFLDALKHLALPVIALTTEMLPIVTRVTRSAMLSELGLPYIVAAKAKGLNEKKVIGHAERNSLVSVLTVSGILLASMLTGLIVIENVFLIEGAGTIIVKAAKQFDYPLMVGFTLMFCIIFTFINLIVDVAYAHINPRISW